jgi:hypothetical protein
MQWPPGRPAWFWKLFDQKNGNYSVRQYGDTACFSRIELIDTPYHRCHNGIRAIYTDYLCRNMFTTMIEDAKRTNNYTVLQTRVLEELRIAFPAEEIGTVIDPPIAIWGDVITDAWHWSNPEYDDISNEAHAEWAALPLGTSEPLCLASTSVHNYYSGWIEGALRSSRQCLTRQFLEGPIRGGIPVSEALQSIYAARDAILPGDGLTSPAFTDVPELVGKKHLANEEWWPYDYSAIEKLSKEKQDYCSATHVSSLIR